MIASIKPRSPNKLVTGKGYALIDHGVVVNRILIRLNWNDSETREDVVDMDGSLFLLAEGNKVTNDGGFVFFNQAQSSCGSATYIGHSDPLAEDSHLEEFFVNLQQLPGDINRLAIAISMDLTLHASAPMPEKLSFTLRNGDNDEALCHYDLPHRVDKGHTIILGHIDREGSAWTVRPTGTVHKGGLGALATSYGVDLR